MKKTVDKRCKNKHPIGDMKMVILGNTVVVCTNCGHRQVFSTIPATYVKDRVNKLKERFHVYAFISLMICAKCHSFMTSINIKCDPIEVHEDSWKREIERTNEDLHSTPDNGPVIPASS